MMGFLDMFRPAHTVGERKSSKEAMDITYHEAGWKQVHGAPYRQGRIKACPREFSVSFVRAPKDAYYEVSVMRGRSEIGYFMTRPALEAAGYSVGDSARARKVRQMGSDTAPWTVEIAKLKAAGRKEELDRMKSGAKDIE